MITTTLSATGNRKKGHKTWRDRRNLLSKTSFSPRKCKIRLKMERYIQLHNVNCRKRLNVSFPSELNSDNVKSPNPGTAPTGPCQACQCSSIEVFNFDFQDRLSNGCRQRSCWVSMKVGHWQRNSFDGCQLQAFVSKTLASPRATGKADCPTAADNEAAGSA